MVADRRCALVVAVVLTARLRRVTSIGRRTTIPILTSVLAVAATFTAAAFSRTYGADGAALERLGWVYLATALLVPCAFLVGMLGARVFAGGALERLVARLSDRTGEVNIRQVLADALGDPSLDVAFWRPQRNEYVDAGGRPVQPPARIAGRSTTVVRQDGHPLAMTSRRCPRHRRARRGCGRSGADDAENARLEAICGVRRGSEGVARPAGLGRNAGGARSSATSTTAPSSAWWRCG